MAEMTEARRGQIALKIVEKQLLEKGIPSPKNFQRDLGNAAKDLGVTKQELEEFYIPFLPNFLAVMLSRKSITLKTE